jgi:hypothetical protein
MYYTTLQLNLRLYTFEIKRQIQQPYDNQRALFYVLILTVEENGHYKNLYKSLMNLKRPMIYDPSRVKYMSIYGI